MRVTSLGHVLPPEVELRRERVVRWTMQGQILHSVLSSLAERSPVVKLETVRFGAAFPALVDEAAASTIPPKNRSAGQ